MNLAEGIVPSVLFRATVSQVCSSRLFIAIYFAAM